MHTKDDTWYEMLSNLASLNPTKANAHRPSHCPKMATKNQNNVKIEHKEKEFVLWVWEMKAIWSDFWMLGWPSASRACFWDDGGLPDWATCVYTHQECSEVPSSRAQAMLLSSMQSQVAGRTAWLRETKRRVFMRWQCNRKVLEEESALRIWFGWETLINRSKKKMILKCAAFSKGESY